MTRKQDSAKGKITAEDLRKMLAEDRDLLKVIIEETLQQVLEAEMDEANGSRSRHQSVRPSAIRLTAQTAFPTFVRFGVSPSLRDARLCFLSTRYGCGVYRPLLGHDSGRRPALHRQ